MKAGTYLDKCSAEHRLCLSSLLIFVFSVLPTNGQIDTTAKKTVNPADTSRQEPKSRKDANNKVQQDQKPPERYLSLFEEEDLLKVSLRFDVVKFFLFKQR